MLVNVNFLDASTRKFLSLIALAQILVILVTAVNLLGFETPILTQVVGFVYLVFVPGALILRSIKFNGQSTVEALLYSVGLSLTFLMLLGVLLNTVGSLFSIGLVSTLPLLATMGATVFALSGIIYFRERGQSEPVSIEPKSKVPWNIFFVCLLPILSVVGTYFMNSYGSNIVLLELLFVLSLVPILLIFIRIRANSYPILIFSIALSLLFYNSLITSNLTGWDTHLEYYFANLVKLNSYWNPTLPSNLNAMLSVVMLGPIFSDIGGLSLVWVFKITYPLLFSLVPVGLFALFRTKVSQKVAFLSCFFFMSSYTFYSDMIQLARQETASIFLVLMLLLLFNVKGDSRQRNALFAIFGISLIVSHYSLTYLFFSALLLIWLAISLSERISSLHAKALSMSKTIALIQYEKKLVSGTLLLLLVLFMFVWYASVASASPLNSGIQIISTISNALPTGLFNPSTTQGLSLLVRSNTLLHFANEGLYLLLQLFIVVGLFAIVFRRQITKFSSPYVGLSFLSLLIAFATVCVPYFSNALNASRFYLFTLFFLAPFCVLGCILLIKGLGKAVKKRVSSRIGLAIVSILLAAFLLFNSGFVYQVANDNPTSMALNTSIDYPRFTSGEVQAAQWIANQTSTETTMNVTVYGDEYGRLLLSEFVLPHVATFYGDMKRVDNSSINYIFLRSLNVKGEVMASWSNHSYVSIQSTYFSNIISNANKVYESSDGDAEVYKIGSP